MYFTYLFILRIVHFDSKYFLFCRTAQKEKIQREKEEAKKERAQQFPSAMTHGGPATTGEAEVMPQETTTTSGTMQKR